MNLNLLITLLLYLIANIKQHSSAITWNAELNRLIIDDNYNEPYEIRGVVYSPVPIGDNPTFPPYGDYFTTDYAYIWKRDFPAIKAMGANTIRIYGWNVNYDHTDFLDALNYYGLKAIITYFIGSTLDTPVSTIAQRQLSINKFVNEITKYNNHPAILTWFFGNELNGIWHKFLDAFADAFNCDWNQDCYNKNTAVCNAKTFCVYNGFFGWLNSAAIAAKQNNINIPISTGFADVDNINDRLKLSGGILQDMNIIGVSVYRGLTFTTFFQDFKAAVPNKGLIIAEMGFDAYNDPVSYKYIRTMIFPLKQHTNFLYL
jgi:hypothetical protein